MNKIEEIKEFIDSNENAMLYISSTMCSACDSVYLKLGNIIENNSNIKLMKIEITENQEVSGEYMVFTVPVIILFKDGKEIHREARFVQFDRLNHYIDNYFN